MARLPDRGLVTPRIVRGEWKYRQFPGNRVFANNCKRLAKAFRGTRGRARLAPAEALFAAVETRSCALEALRWDQYRVVPLLIDVAALNRHWVRSPERWEPSAELPQEQIFELVTYLFERYSTPGFFRWSWRPQRGRKRDPIAFRWYVHVAGGGNIRSAPGLPTRLTKRAAHEMMLAPPTLSPHQALRWGQVVALCGDDAIAGAVIRSRIGTDFANDDLWLPLIERIARSTTGQFPLAQVGPLADYVFHLRAIATRPSQFSLRGRSIATLVRGMLRWHLELGAADLVMQHLGVTSTGRDAVGLAEWKAMSGVSPLVEQRGDERWQLEEIRNFSDLFAEGRLMCHCVATYARSCMRGRTSIWSLRVSRGVKETARATVRVTVRQRQVVEARSFANGPISKASAGFMGRWAKKNRLSLSAIEVA